MPYENPLNYAAGLFAEHDQSVQGGRDETAAAVRAELDLVRPEVEAMVLDPGDDDGKALMALVTRRFATFDMPVETEAAVAEAHARPDPGSEPETKAAGKPRTTKAPQPSRTAVPPASG